MNARRADVLIVGAGPAGSAAAIVLARAGVAVHVVDRATFPRDKLCGDTINPGTMTILARLGLADAIRSQALAISGMRVTGPGGIAVASDYPGGLRGAALTRRALDLLLVEAAARAGACIDTGVAVRAPLLGERGRLAGVRAAAGATERDIGARIVIAADGRHSTLGFALGLSRFVAAPRRWAFGAYVSGVEGMTAHGEMHLRPDGYIGLAPLAGGVTNVCVVRALDELRARRITAADVVREAVAADAQLADRFGRARQLSEVAVLGPLGVEGRAAGRSGLLLAGDAAGFIDPMTGDGLRFALRGGELAAEAALRELESRGSADQFLAAARRREFGGKWRVNRALRRLSGSARGLRVAAALATCWSSPFARLIDIAGDCHLARRAAI